MSGPSDLSRVGHLRAMKRSIGNDSRGLRPTPSIGLWSEESLLRLRPRCLRPTRSYRLNLAVDAVTVSGDDAVEQGRRGDVVVAANGETFRTPGNLARRLKQVNNRWTIDAAK